jgi:hypothetical protein
MKCQGNSYRQNKEPFSRYLEYSYPLESNAYHHRNRVYIGRQEPKCSLVQLCMSRQGTVCMRRQHDIARPGKVWLQELALKMSTVRQQAKVSASCIPSSAQQCYCSGNLSIPSESPVVVRFNLTTHRSSSVSVSCSESLVMAVTKSELSLAVVEQ